MSRPDAGKRTAAGETKTLHPAWQQFIEFCQDLKFGEVERLVIQDGVPVLAEMTKKRVRFLRERE